MKFALCLHANLATIVFGLVFELYTFPRQLRCYQTTSYPNAALGVSFHLRLVNSRHSMHESKVSNQVHIIPHALVQRS